MPSIPRKQPLSEFLPAKAFGSSIRAIAERGNVAGNFWRSRPRKTSSISAMICQMGWTKSRPVGASPIAGSNLRHRRKLRWCPAAILLSPDPRVRRMIANWPVVDWKILDRSEKVETAKENSIIRGTTEMKSRRRGFWCFTRKLNPHVPYETSSRFAGSIGVTLQSLHWGGHLSRDDISRKYWAQIRKFSILSPS